MVRADASATQGTGHVMRSLALAEAWQERGGTVVFVGAIERREWASHLNAGETSAHATLVAPGLTAPYHQHFFNVRLDMTVDGLSTSVVEVDSEALAP